VQSSVFRALATEPVFVRVFLACRALRASDYLSVNGIGPLLPVRSADTFAWKCSSTAYLASVIIFLATSYPVLNTGTYEHARQKNATCYL
jgi:hypothetical protein